MMKKASRWFLILLALLLAARILFGVFSRFLKPMPYSQTIQEGLLFLGILIVLAVLYTRPWVKNWEIQRMVQFAAGLVPAWWIAFWIFNSSRNLLPFPSQFFALQGVFQLCVMLAVLFSAVWLLAVLKELIFIQRGKFTSGCFLLLLTGLCVLILYEWIWGQKNIWQEGGWTYTYGMSFGRNAFFTLFVAVSICNGFRNKWIHYLRKRQKWEILFMTFASGVATFPLIERLPGEMRPLSVTVSVFVYGLLVFWMIYTAAAFLTVLLHLPTAGLMDRRMREMSSLQELSTAIGSVFDVRDLIRKTVGLALQVVDADFSWIELRKGPGFELGGSEGALLEDIRAIPEQAVVRLRDLALRSDSSVLIPHVSRDRETAVFRKWSRKAGALLAARLQYKNKNLGILYAASEKPFGFMDDHRGIFRAFANQAAMALENASLVEASLEKERYREELRLAHEAQMRLLPRSLPLVPGLQLQGLCLTANDIGGDFYDLIVPDQDRIDMVIGDVSGKGASAAFNMAELKGVIQGLARHFKEPRDIVLEINRFIRSQFEPDEFVTMIYATYHPSTRQMRFVRAGHTPVAWIRKDDLVWLESAGLGLGLAENEVVEKQLENQVCRLSPGDTLVFFTDGLIEARNRADEEFGEERLTELLNRNRGLGAADCLSRIEEEVAAFTQGTPRHDDITLVVLTLDENRSKEKAS
ncbi:SpoIIE family protein phosphatase [bacterium]|nr:SpoIIE family protein phosphatase [bacterium]